MVELLTEENNNEPNSVTTFIPNCDPLTMLFILPFMPAIAFMQFHMTMMNKLQQSSQLIPVQNQQKTKVTSITRNGNTLDIIEKWI